MTISLPAPQAIRTAAKRKITILFVAKHAKWQGGLHPEDGNHAIYHQEMRGILENLGFQVSVGEDYSCLFDRPRADFVFPLLNRAGFQHSEMLLPLLCARHGIPFLGASPILRGVSDDKYLTKMIAQSKAIPCGPSALFRRFAPVTMAGLMDAERYVVKPNASSASWGVSAVDTPAEVERAVTALHDQGYDAIVEPFVPGDDIAVSAVMHGGEVLLLPAMLELQDDSDALRTYEEKRDLKGAKTYQVRPFDDPDQLAEVYGHAKRLLTEFMPYDYGRFEMRRDRKTGELTFLEVNLNCNIWSKKTISVAAQSGGWRHEQLIENLLAESLLRCGLISKDDLV